MTNGEIIDAAMRPENHDRVFIASQNKFPVYYRFRCSKFRTSDGSSEWALTDGDCELFCQISNDWHFIDKAKDDCEFPELVRAIIVGNSTGTVPFNTLGLCFRELKRSGYFKD